jgi:hypothetical protein
MSQKNSHARGMSIALKACDAAIASTEPSHA